MTHPSGANPAGEPPVATPDNPLVRFTASGIHGTGGYAQVAIPAGSRVIEYVGERIDKAEGGRRCEDGNRYIFQLDDTWDLDGNVPWNPARFLNHSCDPNCESEIFDDGHIWIAALRDIAAGEELTFNYGYDLDNFQDHACRCGAAGCIGYMVAEEHFDHVRSRKDGSGQDQ